MQLTNEALQSFREHVLTEYPLEACGVVIAGVYFPCKNVHPEPRKHFRCGKERGLLEAEHGPAQAVLHSHTYEPAESQQFLRDKVNPAWASEPDQVGFINDTADWGIVSSDGQGISDFVWLSQAPKPILKRSFNWFADDCYSIVRDWYALNTDIRLPNFTRSWEFWKRGVNTIEEGIASIPFARRITTEEATVGDTVVFAIVGSRVVNHLGVLTSANKILHIYPSNEKGALYYAHENDWDKWKSKARYAVRFK